MNYALLNDQIHIASNDDIFWTKFYMLAAPSFRYLFADDYMVLLADLYRDIKYEISDKLDLTKLVADANHIALVKVFDEMLYMLQDTGNMAAFVSSTGLLEKYGKEDIDKIVASNTLNRYLLKEYFIFLQSAVRNGTFYTLSLITATDLVGEWLSTKESDQLRINYNMTDFTPIGNQIRLRVQKKEDEFCSFECFAKVVDYNYPDKTELICVSSSLIKIENGYIHYFSESNKKIIYCRPVYDFSNNIFTTQVGNIEFSFKRVE